MLNIKPYLLRAIYSWCVDNQSTPHIVVWVDAEDTMFPRQHVRDNQIVLNISPNACQNLNITHEYIEASMRFNGVAHHLHIPIGHVISFFSREDGEVMRFELEQHTPEPPPQDKPGKHQGIKLVK